MSIINQTYKELEIFLINDGSIDNSLIICNDFKTVDTRIKVIDIPNSGVSNARNQGIINATGKFIQFIDSDDFVDTNYIEILYDTIKNTKTDLAVCSIESFNYVGDKLDHWRVKTNVLNFENIDKELFLELIKKFLLFGPVNKLYTLEIILINNIKFDTTLSYGEDLLFNFEYFKYIKSLAITDKIAYKYIHDNLESLSKKKYVNKAAIATRIHLVLLNFFKKVNLTNMEAMNVLYTRLFDDYYNEVFSVANNNQLSFRKKKNIIYNLLNEKELIKSYVFLNKKKYAAWIIFLMKRKAVATFLIVNFILKNKKIVKL
jgi:glycosyltransferase involved in cell wall biosynthesis